MDVITYAFERLRPLALGTPAVRVLQPGEFGEPLTPLPPNKKASLSTYLTDRAPGGLVQLHEPQGILTDPLGLVDAEMAFVDITASSTDPEAARTACRALATRVRLALGHTPLQPSLWLFQRRNLSNPVETNIWRIQDTYQVRAVLGTAEGAA